MLTNLVLDSFEHKKALANIDILECEKDEIKGTDKKSNALRQKKNIEIDERKFYCINVKLNAHHRVRELALWEKIKNEQIKIDPSFDRNNVENSQRQSFTKRWEQEKNLATQTNNGSLYKNVFSSLITMEGLNDQEKS